jgi:glycine dehydrogenase
MTTIASSSPAASVPAESASLLAATDFFPERHIGPSEADVAEMLSTLGVDSLEALSARTVPAAIRLPHPLRLTGLDERPLHGESQTLARLHAIARRNVVARSFIGLGYHDTITPGVIQRNILENPGWYTQYTPYQAEISQGRLEALLNFQTMVSDLTGLPLAGASLLDESTAAAEAMSLCLAVTNGAGERHEFIVASDCHPQTIEVVRTRAAALGITVTVAAPAAMRFTADTFGVLLQYPATDGRIEDHRELVEGAHAVGALAVVATDLLALTRITPPGEFGADVAVGSAQRFGVPMGFGGPHAAFMATRAEYVRRTPGRLIGVSRDAHGNPALRMAIQTREQHIRRDRATSNICTAQVLLAIMAGIYGVYHGPRGLRAIGDRVHRLTVGLADALTELGHDCGDRPFFDTLTVQLASDWNAARVHEAASQRGINLRPIDARHVGVSLDEAVTEAELQQLLQCFGATEIKAAALVRHEIAEASPRP